MCLKVTYTRNCIIKFKIKKYMERYINRILKYKKYRC